MKPWGNYLTPLRYSFLNYKIGIAISLHLQTGLLKIMNMENTLHFLIFYIPLYKQKIQGGQSTLVNFEGLIYGITILIASFVTRISL